MSDSSFQDSLERTRLLVNGRVTDPWQLEINLELRAEPFVDAVMEIGSVLLCHELEGAQVRVSESGLLGFVREDMDKNPLIALEAYLGIVRHSRFPIERGFFARLFGRATPQPHVRWEWRRVRSVEVGEESIRILGQVVRLDTASPPNLLSEPPSD